MTTHTRLKLAPLALLLLAAPARAQEESIALNDARGRDAVEQNCGACHSLDYILMNSPFLDRGKWEATVKKMVGAYGAPVAAEDQAAIVDYLVANYGAR